LLALADLRSPEQIEADEEIERSSKDEPSPLMRAYQDALAACGTFFDLWSQQNNLPAPPCPGCTERELASTDLVAEATMRAVNGSLLALRRERVTSMRVLSQGAQLALL
jgi:hypothetical protein